MNKNWVDFERGWILIYFNFINKYFVLCLRDTDLEPLKYFSEVFNFYYF